jgi:hypothetical protein
MTVELLTDGRNWSTILQATESRLADRSPSATSTTALTTTLRLSGVSHWDLSLKPIPRTEEACLSLKVQFAIHTKASFSGSSSHRRLLQGVLPPSSMAPLPKVNLSSIPQSSTSSMRFLRAAISLLLRQPRVHPSLTTAPNQIYPHSRKSNSSINLSRTSSTNAMKREIHLRRLNKALLKIARITLRDISKRSILLFLIPISKL